MAAPPSGSDAEAIDTQRLNHPVVQTAPPEIFSILVPVGAIGFEPMTPRW
jgi:hypothetical protein